LLTPRWVALHLAVWVVAVTMVFLGRWQLDVSNSKHFDLQNFGYALQWWAFTAFAILLWLRAIRDTVRGARPDQSSGGELVLRRGEIGLTFAGPVTLVAPAQHPGQAPIVYQGYRMPQSSQGPMRGQGDAFHSSYNDYLWQLALADASAPTVHPKVHQSEPEPDDAPEPRTFPPSLT
jgi:hypothetical protein